VENLSIIWQDEHLLVLDKPIGLMVHPSKLVPPGSLFATDMLFEQLGRKVYPVHRLDRPTSGLNIFAFSGELAGKLQEQFRERSVKKEYLALIRGWVPEEGLIDHPLSKGEKTQVQEAQTSFRLLAQTEVEIEVSRYPTSRYSLISAEPLTGRMHQIRRHFAHFRHYIIADSRYGDKKHNKMFRERFALDRLMLHAWKLSFRHPISLDEISLESTIPKRFKMLEEYFDWEKRSELCPLQCQS
jgi:tRNA pseudouridine65 synthase